METIVIRAEYGKVVESSVVEGDLYKVAKEEARQALEEWQPETSDFVIARDFREVEIKLPINPDLYDRLRDMGVPLSRSGGKAYATIPIVLISFDSEMISEEEYQEKKIYIIAPYIDEGFKLELEKEAATLTSPREAPEGISEL
ncbi:MAG: DUF2286 domain-containing protein [Desulfurococcales archaeon]|nr:DUF2286 domain-containing protein [Desulfurococcales archaeon]